MNRFRELHTYPISPVCKAKLTAAGFTTKDDLSGLKATELSAEIGVPAEQALEIIQTVFNEETNKRCSIDNAVSALDMLNDEQSLSSIITFSEEIDAMLGEGVPLCKITEICGAPGVGKTQMAMQLAVDVQIPECFGGIGGATIYIDTEGSLIVERLQDIAKATVEHCQHMAESSGDHEQIEAMKKFTVEYVLSNITRFWCLNYVQLLATVELLPKFVKEYSGPPIKLIVVDSIAFHFRHDFDDLSLRTRLLTSMAQKLINIATEKKLSVVLTNQMTTKIDGSGGRLVPALGESWGHASTIRLILYWEGRQRSAWLYKSPSKQEAVVPFQITIGGIRDITKNSSSEEQPSKRQKLS